MQRRVCRFAILFALSVLALVAAEDGGAALDALRERAAELPLLRVDGERLLWGGENEHAFSVVGGGVEGALLDTPAGRVRVDRALLSREDTEVAGTLSGLTATARRAGMAGTAEDPFSFQDSILLGPRLQLGQTVVSRFGLLRMDETVEAPAPEPLLRPLKGAVRKSLAAAEDAFGNELAREAVRVALERLLANEGEGGTEYYTPRFVRRVIRHGWLEQILPDASGTEALADLVGRLEATAPVWRYRDDEGEVVVEQRRNAFGVAGYLLRTPELVRLNVPMPVPEFYWPHHAGRNTAPINRRASVIVDLAPAADPLESGAPLHEHLQAARIVHDGETLVAWTAADGLEADPARWRSVVPDRGDHPRLDKDAIHGIMPPHIPVTGLLGDVKALITRHGVLVPPRNASREEAERFFADASRLLPDAPHLELIGQYCFQYVFDSPDPTEPRILGSFEHKSDIHQTAFETLATVTGGQFRGDCDDLSELYEHILEKQGKTAHVVSLPAHAACAWAEERDDGWHVFVLQTGPSKEFVDFRLQQALAGAYKSFGADETFDPNGLGLLLRFSGENTRSAWRLSYRIFREPDYAETMIDVQRDWHFQTYLQGVEKMQRMIEEGDEDTANYRELSGLFSFTGQYAKAAEYHRMAIERTVEADSRLLMRVELVNHLLRSGERADALRLAEEILTTDLPPLREDLGAGEIQVGRMLASYLLEENEFELAALALADTSLRYVKRPILGLVAYVDSDRFDQRAWNGNPQLQQARRMGRQFAYTALRLIQNGGADRLAQIPEMKESVSLAQRWLDAVAFHDADDDSDLLRTYGALGGMYADILGQDAFLTRLDAVTMPEQAVYDHTARAAGMAQMQSDLPWIKASVFFWGSLLDQLTDPRAEEPAEREKILRVVDGLEEAVTAGDGLSMLGASARKYAHRSRLVGALLREDAATVREVLAYVAAVNDKRLRDDCTQAIGDKASFMSDAWFDQVVQIWIDEIDYKPKYLWIAWRAVLSEAPQKGVRVAKIAAERFADDPDFVAEHKYMRELLASRTR